MNYLGWALIWGFSAIISGRVFASRGYRFMNGFAIGLVLGPLGVVVVSIIPLSKEFKDQQNLQNGSAKKCPYCAEVIRSEAQVCRYCGRDVSLVIFEAGGARISRQAVAGLSYEQNNLVQRFGFLLSPRDAAMAMKMINDGDEKNVLAFCQARGQRVTSFES